MAQWLGHGEHQRKHLEEGLLCSQTHRKVLDTLTHDRRNKRPWYLYVRSRDIGFSLGSPWNAVAAGPTPVYTTMQYLQTTHGAQHVIRTRINTNTWIKHYTALPRTAYSSIQPQHTVVKNSAAAAYAIIPQNPHTCYLWHFIGRSIAQIKKVT